jgi:hypothetical protein
MVNFGGIMVVIFSLIMFLFTLKIMLQASIMDKLDKPSQRYIFSCYRKNRRSMYLHLSDAFMWKMLIFYPLKFPFTEKERFYLDMKKNYIPYLSQAAWERKRRKWYGKRYGLDIKITWLDDDFAQFSYRDMDASGYVTFLDGLAELRPSSFPRARNSLPRYFNWMVKRVRRMRWSV